jgi:hypothetical protein
MISVNICGRLGSPQQHERAVQQSKDFIKYIINVQKVVS